MSGLFHVPATLPPGKDTDSNWTEGRGGCQIR